MPVYKNPDFRRPPPGLLSIFAHANRQSFFSLPEWYDLLARHATPAGAEIRVYTDERPGSTVAVPLQISGESGRRSLTSLANFYSVEHGLVETPGADLDTALANILCEINAERPRWPWLKLSELEPRDASYSALVRALRHSGYIVECTAGAGTWYGRTHDLTFDEYVHAIPPQLRNTWRRKHKKANAEGKLSAAFFCDPLELERGIADYETVYASSWKPAEPFPEFMPALIRLAAQLGALRLGVFYFNGVPAAAQFWIVWQGRAVIYKLAHNTKFDHLSLGTLLTMEMIRRVLADDRPYEINFGRGDDPYKSLWLAQRRERWGITAANLRTARGLWLGIEREAAKMYHLIRGFPLKPSASSSGSPVEEHP
jgi:hypothetical protein